MAKYKKKPATVEAVQWGSQESYNFLRSQLGNSNVHSIQTIQTPNETTVAIIDVHIEKSSTPRFFENILSEHYEKISMKIKSGDWIIKTADGEVYSMTDESFKKNYEQEGDDG